MFCQPLHRREQEGVDNVRGTYLCKTEDVSPHAVVGTLAPASLMHHRALIRAAADEIDNDGYQDTVPGVSLLFASQSSAGGLT